MKNADVAALLRVEALGYPDEDRGRLYDRYELAVFRLGTFVVRCRPTRQAIEAVAKKFSRGERTFLTDGYHGLPRHTLRRLKGSDAVLAQLADPA